MITLLLEIYTSAETSNSVAIGQPQTKKTISRVLKIFSWYIKTRAWFSVILRCLFYPNMTFNIVNSSYKCLMQCVIINICWTCSKYRMVLIFCHLSVLLLRKAVPDISGFIVSLRRWKTRSGKRTWIAAIIVMSVIQIAGAESAGNARSTICFPVMKGLISFLR